MEDNKRIREMCNNNISEFNYTQQHRCQQYIGFCSIRVCCMCIMGGWFL